MTDDDITKLNDGELIATFGDDKPIPNKPKRKRWSVGPYINFRDLNRQGADGFVTEDNPPKTGVEVGIKLTF